MGDTRIDPVHQVLGRIPSGIFILTCGDGKGKETGLLCSWVQQSAFDPPAITVMVQTSRYVTAWLHDTGQATLNIVGEAGKHLLSHFGRGYTEDQPAFQNLELGRSGQGLPVLQDAIGWLDLNVIGRLAVGDHWLYVMQVIGGGCGETLHEEQPMVHIRKSGSHY